jgi:hypothetical protein
MNGPSLNDVTVVEKYNKNQPDTIFGRKEITRPHNNSHFSHLFFPSTDERSCMKLCSFKGGKRSSIQHDTYDSECEYNGQYNETFCSTKIA